MATEDNGFTTPGNNKWIRMRENATCAKLQDIACAGGVVCNRICKIWGFNGSDYEECRLLGYKNPFRTSQETHYISNTESCQLMLCKIWGFHGAHYEEYRLLGYKNLVLTSQETHYVSATGSSRLMLCKIWGFHGAHYEECRLLSCYAVWLL
jgi:hypothetical protein